MKIGNFKESNCVYAENQKEYLPLPALKLEGGEVITLWKPTWRERWKIMITGNIWLSILTFNRPLQPLMLYVDKPFEIEKENTK